MRCRIYLAALLLVPLLGHRAAAGNYRNFRVAVYSRSFETQKMGDAEWLARVWDDVSNQVAVDKIYLETHRDLVIVDQETLDKAKAFFKARGVETAGGITLTIDEGNRFETFCYTNPEHRAKVREIVEYTARNFDELILDDFFFTSCKCDLCIAAKGEQSWTQYRLKLMEEAARDLVIAPAKRVNPDIKVVIKYPNWYDHFQGLGFNLEAQPAMFDGIYTGTETRDPSSSQHLQAYLGYNIFRYFENLKPGGNGGGWVDTGGMRYLDRYAEQLWLTLFAKAPEITLFDIRQLQYPIRENLRAPWQGSGTSFDYADMMKPVTLPGKAPVVPATLARAAGWTFEKVDRFLGALGNPSGLKCYKPFHSTGEDFLPNFLGMAGIPIDLVPEFPAGEKVILLTEASVADPSLVGKIKRQLQEGGTAVVTTGLLRALQDRGLGDIAEIRCTDRKALVSQFVAGWGPPLESTRQILIPQVTYLTNDSWEEISALDDTNGWPVLHFAGYSTGKLYVLTIPDNFTDLCFYPEPVLNRIRQTLTSHLEARLEGPGYASLFLYDNDAFIAESFADSVIRVKIVTAEPFRELQDLETGETFTAVKRQIPQRQPRAMITEHVFSLELKPHSFKVLRGKE